MHFLMVFLSDYLKSLNSTLLSVKLLGMKFLSDYFKELTFNKILILVILAIFVFIIFFTAFSFASGKANFGKQYRKSDPSTVEEIKDAGGQPTESLEAFKELGQIRSSTKPENNVSALVIVSPWLSYTKNDEALHEELIQKKQVMLSIFSQYFSFHTQKELYSIGEAKVKEELLEKINSSLVLGKAKGLYFDSYLFLE